MRRVSALLLGALLSASCSSTGRATPPERFGRVPVGDSFLHYGVRGSGPTLVLVHGGQTDLGMWDPQVETFARTHRVPRYDVRGFGRSGDVGEPYASHEDLAALLDALDVERCSVIGLSLGGRIAIDFALDHPDRVERLVLAAPGLTGWDWSGEEHAFFQPIVEAAVAGDTRRACELWLQSPYMVPAMERAEVAATLRELAFRNQRSWLLPPVETRREPPATEQLEALSMPVLLIVGDRDVPDISRIADVLEERVPDLERLDLAGVGHMPNLEARATFDEAVSTFLSAP